MSFAGSLGNNKNFTIRDYTHASRTFVSDNYALLPKTKRWWHVYFRLTDEASKLYEQIQAETNPSGGLRFSTATENIVNDIGLLSVLAKTVKLPGIKLDTKKHNNYNKQLININKINYDDISISFHDDASGSVRAFWDAYYLYYVQDSRYRDYSTISGQGLGIPDAWKTDQIPNDNSIDPLSSLSLYGNPAFEHHHYGLDTVNQTSGGRGIEGYLDRRVPFLDFVKIYHFTRPSGSGTEKDYPHYVEYTLVNPVITIWEQDTLDYASTESAENTMTLSYETILYATGKLNKDNSEISSWNQVVKTRYDNRKVTKNSVVPNNAVIPAVNVTETNTGVSSGSSITTNDSISRVPSWDLEENQPTDNFTGTQNNRKLINSNINKNQNYFNPRPNTIVVPNPSAGSSTFLKLPSK